MPRKISYLFLVALIFVFSSAHAGFMDFFKKQISSKSVSTGQTNLSEDEIKKGLKEALLVASKRVVTSAGKEGGFLNNPKIKIPLPPTIEKIAILGKQVGLTSQVKEFEVSMNHAAEKATVEALPVFKKAISEITIEDAKKIWKGGDHSITDYFKQKTEKELVKRFSPIIDKSLSQVGVTNLYKKIMDSSYGKKIRAYFGNKDNFSLKDYVTNNTLKGLFTLMAEEEVRIRKNPVARTTELLKKLFGK